MIYFKWLLKFDKNLILSEGVVTVELRRLADVANELGLLTGDFTLSSGETTPNYFDGRLVTLSPDGLEMVVDALCDILPQYSIDAIGGPTLGADAVVGATMDRFQRGGKSISGFLVRAERKVHGTNKLLEGPLSGSEVVAIFDDTITSGKSILNTIAVVEELGCRVAVVVVLLDRKAGGLERIRDAGYYAIALLELEPDGEIIPADVWGDKVSR